MKPIVIVDYGMGNLRSVQKAFEKVGHAAQIVSEPAQVGEAAKLVLPGVGAFGDAITRIREAGLAEPILDHLNRGRPFLGICLGLQLLFAKSYEGGEYAGLGLFDGEVTCFSPTPGVKVPHMGWNQLRLLRRAPLFESIVDGASVYFVHSYYPVPRDPSIVAAETNYPDPFASVIWRDNVLATQFHPEKSQTVGLAMLTNFARM